MIYQLLMSFNPGIYHKKWQLIIIPAISLVVVVLIMFKALANGTFSSATDLFFTICVFTFCIREANNIVYRLQYKSQSFFKAPGKRLVWQLFLSLIGTWLTFGVLFIGKTLLVAGNLRALSASGFIFFLVVATIISLFINGAYIITYLQQTCCTKRPFLPNNLTKIYFKMS